MLIRVGADADCGTALIIMVFILAVLALYWAVLFHGKSKTPGSDWKADGDRFSRAKPSILGHLRRRL